MKEFYFKDLSIRTKLWFVISAIVIVIVMLVTIIASSLMASFIYKEAERDLLKNIQQLSEKINFVFNDAAIFSKMAISNKEIQDFSERTKEGNFNEEKEIQRLLADFVIPKTYIEAINLYLKANNHFYSSNHYPEMSPYLKYNTTLLDTSLTPSNLEIWELPFYSEISEQFLLPYFRKVYFGKSGKILGILELLIPVEMIISTIENSIFSEKGNLYIIDNEGTIILHDDENKILKSIDSLKLSFLKKNLNSSSVYNRTILCYSQVLAKTNWIIINEVPKDLLLDTARRMKRKFTIIGMMALLVSVFCSYKLSSLITRPLRDMEDCISTMDNLEYRKYMPVKSKDEIGRLGRQYNFMIDRIAASSKLEEKREVQIKQYELALLQSQINPHFLNNTLENICGLIELDRKDDSITLIGNTAEFYRSILSTDNLIIDLEQELKIVTMYVKIQNTRCNNKIRFKIDIPEKYLNKHIVKLTLQPLVENSIKHGMNSMEKDLNITIQCYENDEFVIINVEDNGLGMDQNILNSHLQIEPKTLNGKTKHIGVYATNQRLKLHFGEQYGLRYFSQKGQGTVVEIYLPKEFV